MPPTMMAKSSPRVTRARYGRTNADEHVRGGGQADDAAHAHRLLEQEGDDPDDEGQHPPVEEQRRERAHHQDQRQRAEREHEGRVRVGDLERRRPAAEVAEDEAGARLGRLLEHEQRVVQLHEQVFDDGDF
jgi:hypothetical protein